MMSHVELLLQYAQAQIHCEGPIALRTHFTGEPPYVGWEGLGKAMEEVFDERDALQKKVKWLAFLAHAALNQYFWFDVLDQTIGIVSKKRIIAAHWESDSKDYVYFDWDDDGPIETPELRAALEQAVKEAESEL